MTFIQKPNKLLIITLTGSLVGLITSGILHTLGSIVYIMAGSIWSYVEMTKGINTFRKLLGAFVLLLIFLNLFMHLK